MVIKLIDFYENSHEYFIKKTLNLFYLMIFLNSKVQGMKYKIKSNQMPSSLFKFKPNLISRS